MSSCRLHRPYYLIVPFEHTVRDSRGAHHRAILARHAVHHGLLHYAGQLTVVQRQPIRGSPLLYGAPQGKVGDELEVSEFDTGDGARLVTLLQPALDERPVVSMARGHHHRIYH